MSSRDCSDLPDKQALFKAEPLLQFLLALLPSKGTGKNIDDYPESAQDLIGPDGFNSQTRKMKVPKTLPSIFRSRDMRAFLPPGREKTPCPSLPPLVNLLFQRAVHELFTLKGSIRQFRYC